MFAFLACLAQAKATGAENPLDIKFMFRLRACLRSYVSSMFSVPGRFFHIPLCHTHNRFNFSILHHLLCLSFLPRPRYNL